jgi:outer membrane protein assembly factor BamB
MAPWLRLPPRAFNSHLVSVTMSTHTSSRIALTLLVFSAILPVRAADNWPQWRGPQANGVATEGKYPVKFSADSGVAWKVELPGLGMSTPAVWGDRIFVTCGIDGKDSVVAYDFDGDELWRKSFDDEVAGKHQNGSGSNPSPVTDGKHVVVYYKSGTLACLDLNGNVVWRKSMEEEHGPNTLWWDLGNSPVISGGRVIVAVMQSGDSFLVAYNLADGEQAWKQQRQYTRPDESDHSYTTPQLASVAGRDVLVTFGADHLTGHDATTGELLWDVPESEFNPRDEANWRVIASQVVSDGIVLTPYGRAKFLSGIRISGGKPEKLWERGPEERDGADVPTPVAVDGKGYVLTDKGRVLCIDLETGEDIWDGAVPGNRNKYYASPVLAGGKLYCAREDGMVFVVDVRDGFKLLSENDMGEKVIATPVPVRGGLLIRGVEHLFRVEGGANEEQSAG